MAAPSFVAAMQSVLLWTLLLADRIPAENGADCPVRTSRLAGVRG